jgi:hypothetical protein
MGLRTVPRATDAVIRRLGRVAVSVAPQLEDALLTARDRYARAVVAARTAANRRRYDAPPDPYRLVRVDPARIERVAGFARPMYQYAGLVAGGDWDRPERRFADLDVYQAYHAHFEHGVPWTDTAFFDRVVSEIEAGQPRWGCETRAEFEARCDRLDDLYDYIASRGFRSQAALADGGTDAPFGRPPGQPTERYKREVAVHVGRDGELLFADGRNRLSIAKLLGLERIPVRVLCRHADWQATRDAVARGAAVNAPLTHPDLDDCRTSSG